MAYITEAQLKGLAESPRGIQTRQSFALKERSLSHISIFLSHCHEDKNIVEGLISLLLAQSQILVYVDWKDNRMPEETNRQTANRIKEKIEQLDYFMILATNNALKSRWVPWEIGIADSKKPISKILLVPVADATGRFEGNEYLQLYNKVDYSVKGNLCVFEPNEHSGYRFEQFVEK